MVSGSGFQILDLINLSENFDRRFISLVARGFEENGATHGGSRR